MKHCECIHYINLDCEKGMCALTKKIVLIDGKNSEACGNFEEANFCGNCANFNNPNNYGIGTCKGFEKENWTYAKCGAFSCEKYKRKK